ncbi:DEAD/DEAH box helicase family protein, partial [bacterium]|nr:DEAD/DEAH box helicase family protein [bacterium]
MATLLYDRLLMKFGEDPIKEIEIPKHLSGNLNPEFVLRPYQVEAFQRFICYYEKEFDFKLSPIHLLTNMATGSGKTLIMAGLILYLYEKGYRNFLFFVPSTNIIDKTIDNFLNASSRKFLFNQTVTIDHKRVEIQRVDNFEAANPEAINICFTTIQKLHSDLYTEKENSLTFEDFKDKRIVLISDEAHHSQALTKKKNNNQIDADFVPTWENTVEKLFKTNSKNLLLEFTATIDYSDRDIVHKYENKIIYRYDLADFRLHGYSKDVHILKANIDKRDRILQAVLLNQYRQDVAGKHGIFLKPVILFKAQRTIAQSQENENFFHEIFDKLKAIDIAELRKRLSIPLIQKVFQFYKDEGISDSQLAHRLNSSFAPKYCLNVNEENLDKKSIRTQDRKEVIEQELLLNRLEDKDNDIRAIFAVQKLNEGWDVLNLFDIVRLYTERDTRHNRPGKTTIAEAQLIGRGARYFPFQMDNTQDKYTRKYDNSLTHDLRIIEELHYHSIDDSKYISELRTVLKEKGIIDDDEIELELFLKEDFKKHKLYQSGQVYK